MSVYVLSRVKVEECLESVDWNWEREPVRTAR